MTATKINLEVEIPNVDVLLDEMEMNQAFPVEPYPSSPQSILHQGLQWSAKVKLKKPGPTSQPVPPEHRDKTHLFCCLYCTNPATENKTWKYETHCVIDLMVLNTQEGEEPYSGIRKRGKPSFQHGNAGGKGFYITPVEHLFLDPQFVKDNKALVRIEFNPETLSGLHLDQKRKIEDAAIATERSRRLALLHNWSGCNVTLQTKDEKSIEAHRDILMAASPVFEEMFDPFKEAARDGQADIDMTLEVAEYMMEVIYGAPLSILDNIPVSLIDELIQASQVYQMGALKDYCGILLLERVNPENVPQLQEMVDKYRLVDEVRVELETFGRDQNQNPVQDAVDQDVHPEDEHPEEPVAVARIEPEDEMDATV